MPATMPDLTGPSLTITAWHDPVIDTLGHPPRSTYVERFWLSILGPSTTWLVRHVDVRLETDPEGFTLDLEATAGALGLGTARGRHSPLVRALHRCCQFGVARAAPAADLSVRRHLPPLTRHQIDRLPPAVRADHDAWRATERDAATLDAQKRRARRIALALAEIGEDVPTMEQRLQRYRVHPLVARDAAVWAHRVLTARELEAPPAPEAELAPAVAALTASTVPAAEREIGGDAA